MKRIRRGIIVVLSATETNKEVDRKWNHSIFYISKKFPVTEFNQAMKQGFYTARRATQNEKEYCFHMLENSDKEGFDISGFVKWNQERNK